MSTKHYREELTWFIVDLSVPLTYCDRVQIRPPGDRHFGLPPHVDGGGVERWEDQAYNHVYRKIFQGKVRYKIYL